MSLNFCEKDCQIGLEWKFTNAIVNLYIRPRADCLPVYSIHVINHPGLPYDESTGSHSDL